MCKTKYPIKIQAWVLMQDGIGKREPVYVEIIYNEIEKNSFIDFLNQNPTTKFQLKQFKPKLKDLSRLKWYQKAVYLIPFKTELNDILVDGIKFAMGILIGYALSKGLHI